MTIDFGASTRALNHVHEVVDHDGGERGAAATHGGPAAVVVLGGDPGSVNEASGMVTGHNFVAQVRASLRELTGHHAQVLTSEQVLELLDR